MASDDTEAATIPALKLSRVRPAYEQVTEQLRELIVRGQLPNGARLPTEPALAKELGVSRTTVREALRTLAAEGLIQTTKGVGGGNTVSRPDRDQVVKFLSTSLALGTHGDEVTLDDFMELRRFLEIPAAGMAASRRSDEDMHRLDATAESPTGGAADQLERNQDFHATLADVCHNRLLEIAAQPIFLVLQTRLDRSTLGRSFHRTVAEQHQAISRAINNEDATGAEQLMADHLDWLLPHYRKAWVG